MKYNININQKAVVDLGLDLDLQDMAIFDFMTSFSLTKSCMSVNINNETYYWFSYKKIIEELPMLGIKTRQGINKKIEKLINAGLIIRYEENVTTKKSYFKFGEIEALFYGNKTSLPATNVADDLQQMLRTTSNKCCRDNNTIYNNTIYNKKQVDEKHLHASSKCKFRNCEVYNWDEAKIRERINTKTCIVNEDVDIMEYVDRVFNWSETSSKLRDTKGWLATIRNFIKGDVEKNQVKMLNSVSAELSMEDYMEISNL